MSAPSTIPSEDALLEHWRAAWPKALAVWSKFTRLRDPRLCETRVEAVTEGLSGSFAMIRLLDQSVVIDMQEIVRLKLQDYAVEILAHEIGHHVLAPGSTHDQFRLMARMRRALPTIEHHAAMVAILYTDLYINDRLQRQAALRMGDIYRRIAAAQNDPSGEATGVWSLYLGIYEQLWKLDKGALGTRRSSPELDSDAWLGARLIRVYAGDWMTGAGRFATLILPYLIADKTAGAAMTFLHDTRDAAQGCEPCGAQEIEADEIDGIVHPVEDPLISGLEGEAAREGEADLHAAPGPKTGGQTREPFEYGEILRASGIKLSDHDIAVRYYRERALPHLVRFPKRIAPQSPEAQLEAVEPWDVGDPLDEIDWLQSVMQSPRPVPGMTTVRRTYGVAPDRIPETLPVDLDMYVDSSGSMPNPQTHTSYLALAGAIIALSALRAGSRVKVTLWSSKNQVLETKGFVADSEQVLHVLTGFFGGGTTFPIHRMRETYCESRLARPTHILHISDDGITSMFEHDEKGNSGWDIAARALAAGAAGGTMALNIAASWEAGRSRHNADLHRARKQGWDIHAIEKMDDLVEFARRFSQRHYSPA